MKYGIFWLFIVIAFIGGAALVFFLGIKPLLDIRKTNKNGAETTATIIGFSSRVYADGRSSNGGRRNERTLYKLQLSFVNADGQEITSETPNYSEYTVSNMEEGDVVQVKYLNDTVLLKDYEEEKTASFGGLWFLLFVCILMAGLCLRKVFR